MKINARAGDLACVKLDGRDISDSVVWVDADEGTMRRYEKHGRRLRVDESTGYVATYFQAVKPSRITVQEVSVHA